MLAKAIGSMRRDVLLSDLQVTPQFDVALLCLGWFWGWASALRGQCPCGGQLDFWQAKHAKGSGVSICEHALTAAATFSVAATGEKTVAIFELCAQVPSAGVAATDSVAVPRIPGNSPRAGRMPVQPRLRAT
eukprot:3285689-Amphidinium_carterae.1